MPKKKKKRKQKKPKPKSYSTDGFHEGPGEFYRAGKVTTRTVTRIENNSIDFDWGGEPTVLIPYHQYNDLLEYYGQNK